MHPETPELGPQTLLAQAAFVRALARGLVSGDLEAEDLAQETLVTALERPPRQPGALRAWLGRVACRLAWKAHRRDLRRERRERLAGPTASAPSPIEILACQEELLAVGAAVRALPDSMRIAVHLRYFEDLPPRAIAERLGEPVATVKSRLKRALARLRELLDESHGGDRKRWLAGLAPLLAFDAPGAIVPGAAAAGAATTVASAALGGIAMKKLLLAGSALLLLALLGLFVAGWFDSADILQPELGAPASLLAASEGPTPSSPAEGPETPLAAPTAPPERHRFQEEPLDPGEVIVTGRCLAAETGSPLSGGQVTLVGRPILQHSRDYLQRYGYGPEDRSIRLQAAPGPDGRFSFRFESRFHADLVIESPGRVQVRHSIGYLGSLQAGRSIDLGDIRLQAGWQVQGKVVAPEGTPAAGIRFQAYGIPGIRLSRTGVGNPDPEESWIAFGVSDPQGRLVPSGLLPPGTWSVRGGGGGLALAKPRSIFIPAGSPPAPIIFRMLRRESIAGVVVDEAGVPVAGANLVAKSPQAGPAGSTRSSQDGSFSILAEEGTATDRPVEIAIQAETSPCEPNVHPVPVAWGSKDLRLVVGRSATVVLEVAEKETGRPVPDYLARLTRVGGNPQPPRATFGQEDGSATFQHVLRGAYTLTVIPKRADLLWVDDHPLQVDRGGEVKLKLLVPSAASEEILVLGKGDVPLTGVTVELLDPREARNLVDGISSGHSMDPRAPFAKTIAGGTFTVTGTDWPLCFTVATTDAAGRAAVHGPPGAGPLALRLSGAGIIKQVVPGIFLSGSRETIVVRVMKGAILSGTVRPQDALAYDNPGFRLEQVGGPGRHPASITAGYIPIDAAGNFRAEGIKPGIWKFFFRAGRVDLPTGHTVTLETGKEQRLVLHLDEFVPARLIGRIVEPEQTSESWLRREGDYLLRLHYFYQNMDHFFPITIGERDSAFEFPVLPPGKYVLGRYYLSSPSPSPIGLASAEEFHLEPGQHAVREFSLGQRKVCVQLVGDRSGKPLAGVEVEASDRYARYPVLQSDSEGRILLPWFPFESLRVACLGREFGPLEIPVGKEPTLVVSVPE